MSRAEDYLAHSFREVDAGDTSKMMRCLTFMDGLPVFQEYKSVITAKLALRPGATVADLGCGLGFDVHHFAALVGPEGKALGIDASHALLLNASAASKPSGPACFIQAYIQHLPLADASLDACKVDRTLQHVEEPPVVLNEIFRTLRPGGRVVCSEPDWSTFVIDDQDRTASQIAAFFYQGFRNPRIGYELKGLLETAGFIDLQTQEVVLSTTGFASSDIVFDISQSAARLAENSKSEEPLTWLANLRQRLQPLCCSVNLVIQFARRP
jgi:ubiquinone/menaquinone biosynthesis C-methylase UbiE